MKRTPIFETMLNYRLGAKPEEEKSNLQDEYNRGGYDADNAEQDLDAEDYLKFSFFLLLILY